MMKLTDATFRKWRSKANRCPYTACTHKLTVSYLWARENGRIYRKINYLFGVAPLARLYFGDTCTEKSSWNLHAVESHYHLRYTMPEQDGQWCELWMRIKQWQCVTVHQPPAGYPNYILDISIGRDVQCALDAEYSAANGNAWQRCWRRSQ